MTCHIIDVGKMIDYNVRYKTNKLKALFASWAGKPQHVST